MLNRSFPMALVDNKASINALLEGFHTIRWCGPGRDVAGYGDELALPGFFLFVYGAWIFDLDYTGGPINALCFWCGT